MSYLAIEAKLDTEFTRGSRSVMNRHNVVHTPPQTGQLIIFMTQYTQRNVLNQTNRNMTLGKFPRAITTIHAR